MSHHVRVAVIGTGFSGLAALIQLVRHGRTDVVAFERGDSIGGTWRDNTYPGCACDVPSLVYSLSFALKPDWTRAYAEQPEIRQYLEDVADEFDVRRYIRLNHDVRSAEWDDGAQLWRLGTDRGDWTADVLISATGPLSEPTVPDLPGMASFTGSIFHSARWDHAVDLRGKRVAVVGTGASAIQVVPSVQPEVASLTLFQRTPAWVLPRRDHVRAERVKRLVSDHPSLLRLARGVVCLGRESMAYVMNSPRGQRLLRQLGERHIARAIDDPQLRGRLTPDYAVGCKRILTSNTYYRALTEPNVRLVTAGIRELTPDGVVDAEGTSHVVDVVILATGFHMTDSSWPTHVRGRGGRSLREAWQGSPGAYLGMTVPDFPNLFLLLGPNTGLGHNSVVIMAEAQVRHLLKVLDLADRRGAAAVEPTREACAVFVRGVDARLAGSVWKTGRCANWYTDTTGRVAALWPGTTLSYRRRLARVHPGAYRWSAPRGAASAASGGAPALHR